MPVHDWSRVGAGVFHDFHSAWIVEIRNVLNGGLLPPDYYALAEQYAGTIIPDVLTLYFSGPTNEPFRGPASEATVLAVQPPRARFTQKAEIAAYRSKQRTLVIRHRSGDQVVALVEIVSPGNKASRVALREFVEKTTAALARGIHALVIDLHAPTPRDPQGIHGAIWVELEADDYVPPSDKPLTLVSYAAGDSCTAYIEPIAVGDVLPNMPLFLTPEYYIEVPLETTYQAAWRGVPARWRAVLEPGPAS